MYSQQGDDVICLMGIAVWMLASLVFYDVIKSEGIFYAWDVGDGKEPQKMSISIAESDRYNWGMI